MRTKTGDKSQTAEVDERRLVASFAPVPKPSDAAIIDKITDAQPVHRPDRTALKSAEDAKSGAQSLKRRRGWTFWRVWLTKQVEIEQTRGTAFLLVPILLIAGIATYFSLPTEPALHNVASALLVLLVARYLIRRQNVSKALFSALFLFAFGMGLAQWRTLSLDTPMLGSEVTTRLTGRIIAIEHRPNGSIRYTLDVVKTERPQLRYAPDRIRATARKPAQLAQLGQGLEGVVRLRPPSGPVRPNGFDFAFNNYFQGIGANGFFLGAPEPIPLAAGQWDLQIKIESIRFWLAQRIRGQNPTEIGAVSAALITGDKAAIPEQVNEQLRRSGLAHILSISGLHMALVAGTVMFALRALWALAPANASALPIKKIAALAGFVAIFVYLFLAGASVATQRSFIMLGVMLGALLSDRSAITMRNLAIATIIVVLVAPESTLGPSFQMSFAATMALIAAYQAWTARRNTRQNPHFYEQTNLGAAMRWLGAFIAGLSMTSIIAGTATGLFAAYHFQRVAVFGLLGNLFAMPIVSLITMPFAIMATLLIPFGLDGSAYAAMNWSVEIVLNIAAFVARLSPAGNVGAISPMSVVLLTGSLLMLCVFRSRFRYLGLLFVVPAVIALKSTDVPILVVSEDSRQMAVLLGEGKLAVNRTRPNAFVLEQWQSAYKSQTIIKPDQTDGFICDGDLYCEIKANEAAILYIQNAEYFTDNANALCNRYDIIIQAYAPVTQRCHGTTTDPHQAVSITAQQLALFGSAEVRMAEDRPGGYYIKHALGEAKRHWQSHRRFSRSARNLAPYRRSNQ